MLMLDRLVDYDIHTIADFAELLCLLKPDRVLSSEDLEDYLVDECGEQRGVRSIGDAFAHMAWRAKAFGDRYPFAVASNLQSICVSNDPMLQDELTAAQELYVFLLLCSNLSYVGPPYNQLTDAFERLAYLALKRMWSARADVRLFGKNTSQYSGTKSARLHKLATEMGGSPNVDPTKFRLGDGGDGGIDVVGWLDLDAHEARNKVTFLAQCACSRSDWPNKQLEITRTRIGQLLNPSVQWLEILCTPICFRDNNGRWAYGSVAEIVMIDRLRLVEFIDPESDMGVGGINPPPALKEFLECRMEIT